MTVETYIENVENSNIRSWAWVLYNIIHEVVPNVQTKFQYKVPSFLYFGWMCYRNIYETHIELGFIQGAKLSNEQGLLSADAAKGKGKSLTQVRKIFIRSLADLQQPAIREIIAEAALVNELNFHRPLIKMKNFIILICLLFSIPTIAQQKSEGSIRYLVTENYTKIMASLTYLSKQQREREQYMWGDRFEWKIYTTLYFNEKETKYITSEEKADNNQDDSYSGRSEVFTLRHNYEKNTRNDAMDILSKTYIIEDTLAKLDWKIMNDIKDVAGHLCMKAVTTDTVRLQKTVAWFAMDMPLSGGPDRFYGLPGMILEIDINDGGMIVSADKIDLKPVETELTTNKKIKGKKINAAEYQKIIKEHIEGKIEEEQYPYWGIRY